VATFNALARRRINPFIGPPDAFTSFVHADDAGTAVAAALSIPAGTYNVADDEPLTRLDAGRAVADALGVKPPRSLPAVALAAMPASAKGLVKSLRVSNAKLKDAGVWAPSHPSIRGSWAVGSETEVAS
jgi:nucleoside-diphosphate-sugar epimerase